MIHHVRGRVLKVAGRDAVIEAGGLGYEITCTDGCAARLRPGQDATVLTYMHLNQDGVTKLYGFSDEPERAMFLALKTVRGVGPALALSVLSTLGVPELVGALMNEDARALLKVKGVGRKTAEHILLDLRDRVPPAASAAAASRPSASGASVPTADAVAALVSLGYAQAVAARAVEEARRDLPDDEDVDIQQLVRMSLAKAGF